MRKSSAFRIRLATAADAPLVARHRVEMFRDLERVATESAAEALRAASEPVLRQWVAAGTYIGWLAEPEGQHEVVGGAGLQLRPLLPRPTEDGSGAAAGPEGYVLNVFVEREWRRRGLARMLMGHVLAYVREHGITRCTLHSSAEGNPLYESLGFTPTLELRHRTSP